MSKENNNIWANEDHENIKIYDELLAEHGVNFKSLDWGSRQSQLLRFKVLVEIGIKNNNSILDVGCGLGDLYAWFEDNNIKVNYTGTDITPSLILAARERFLNVNFVETNLMDEEDILNKKYDYVFASGIFAKRQEGAESYVFAMVEKMFQICQKGLAFNSLSLLSDQLDTGDFGLDPHKLIDFCRTLSPWVCLRHDYHPNDMTVYIYRQQQK